MQLEGFNTKTMTYDTKIEFRAPTQNSYLHRITAFDHGNLAIATEILTDKFLVIMDSHAVTLPSFPSLFCLLSVVFGYVLW